MTHILIFLTIGLSVLMGPGQDPHSYEPAARDLTDVALAQVIFVNGWGLEEGLVEDLETIGEGAPVVPVSANIEPLAFGDDDLRKLGIGGAPAAVHDGAVERRLAGQFAGESVLVGAVGLRD